MVYPKQTTQLQEVLDALLNEQGIRFGKAWHAKETIAAVVPIILEGAFHKRGYLVAEEVKQQIQITDTGGISRLKIVTGMESPVFVRSGSVLKGNGTQSRAVEVSTMVHGEKDLAVRCVHASHGIRSGAKFELAGAAPIGVESSLYSRSQGNVWASVKRHNMGYMASKASAGSFTRNAGIGIEDFASDNLVQTITSEDYTKTLDKFIRELPNIENQIGIVVIDIKGVLGLELFDHPDSWKAVSTAIIQKYGEVFTKPAKTPFKLDLDEKRLREIIATFIATIKKASVSQGTDDTKLLSGTVKGEFSVFESRIIHIVALRTDIDNGDEPVSNISLEEMLGRERPRYMDTDTSRSGYKSRRFTDTSRSCGILAKDKFTFESKPRSIKKKVLFSGIDEELDFSLQTFASKEFNGDKSKAARKLLRNGLEKHEYL